MGSCGAWAFGEKVEVLIQKPTTQIFLSHWERVFSKVEGKSVYHCLIYKKINTFLKPLVPVRRNILILLKIMLTPLKMKQQTNTHILTNYLIGIFGCTHIYSTSKSVDFEKMIKFSVGSFIFQHVPKEFTKLTLYIEGWLYLAFNVL